jgi:phytoene synthase
MRSDTKVHVYKTRKQLEKYMFGSAEVIGLMMARILDLPKESYDSAKLLGKSMQLANFIRDIQVDINLCRQYLPYEDLSLYGISSLTQEDISKKKDAFVKLVRHEISWYKELRIKARSGFHYIPYRYRIPIETASDMYDWTMDEISKDPFIVYSKVLKPSRVQIVNTALSKSITLSRLGNNFSKYESL